MNEYYNFDEFDKLNKFNNESDDLDKLAREINNKKTSLVKKVTEDYETQQKNWKNGINQLKHNQKYSFLPMNKNNVTNYDNSYQKLNYNNLNGYDKFDNFDNLSFDSLYSDSFKSQSESESYFVDSESLDLYLDDAKKSESEPIGNKNNFKNNFKSMVNSISYDECSKDDDNIFDHIKKCLNCKNKLLKYLNDNNDIKQNNFFNFKLNKIEQLSMKELIVIIMIGVFIIILLDLLFGFRSNKY